MKIRPIHLRRSWLFVGATNEKDIQASFQSEADVCILDFEDFCSPKDRPKGRKLLSINMQFSYLFLTVFIVRF